MATEQISLEPLSMSRWTYRFAGLQLHSVEPLIAFLGVVRLRIAFVRIVLSSPAHPGFSLLEVKLGAAIKMTALVT